PPANPVAGANNAFAFDLYARLAREKEGKGLFFSPYSVTNALVMVAEGARGETADEMGKVLLLPRLARRVGDVPWDLGPIHAGLGSLNRRFEAASRPTPPAMVEKLAALRDELHEARRG